MNPVHQSLSNLLRNPALQTEGTPIRGASRNPSVPEGSETLEVSSAARQSLARANAAAALPAVGNLAEAEGLTRMVREALTGGVTGAANAHGRIDPQTAEALLR